DTVRVRMALHGHPIDLEATAPILEPGPLPVVRSLEAGMLQEDGALGAFVRIGHPAIVRAIPRDANGNRVGAGVELVARLGQQEVPIVHEGFGRYGATLPPADMPCSTELSVQVSGTDVAVTRPVKLVGPTGEYSEVACAL